MPVISDVRHPMLVYDVDLLSLVLWDGEVALSTGAVTIGTVDQGLGGASAWKVDGSAVTQPVSGPLTDAQLRALAVPVSGTVGITSATLATEATLSTLNGKVTAVNTGAVVVSSSALPSGAATAAGQLPDGHNVTVDNASLAVTGPLTDAELRATPVPVSGTVSTTGATYIVRLDEASATITYVGNAAAGSATASAVWQVKRLDSTTGLAVLFADGNTNFDNTWDGRAGFSYS